MNLRLVVQFDPDARRWSAVFPELPGYAPAGDKCLVNLFGSNSPPLAASVSGKLRLDTPLLAAG